MQKKSIVSLDFIPTAQWKEYEVLIVWKYFVFIHETKDLIGLICLKAVVF